MHHTSIGSNVPHQPTLLWLLAAALVVPSLLLASSAPNLHQKEGHETEFDDNVSSMPAADAVAWQPSRSPLSSDAARTAHQPDSLKLAAAATPDLLPGRHQHLRTHALEDTRTSPAAGIGRTLHEVGIAMFRAQ